MVEAYWSPGNPWASAYGAGHGTTITVNQQLAGSMAVSVDNTPEP